MVQWVVQTMGSISIMDDRWKEERERRREERRDMKEEKLLNFI